MKNNAVILREIDATFATELTRLWIRTFSEAYSEEHTAENIQLYCETHFTEPLAAAALADPAQYGLGTHLDSSRCPG